MKKFFQMVAFASLTVAMSACYNDDELWNKVDELETKVEATETKTSEIIEVETKTETKEFSSAIVV